MLSPLEIKYRLLSFFVICLFTQLLVEQKKSDLFRRRNIEPYSRKSDFLSSLESRGRKFRSHSHKISLVLQNVFKCFC
jgi:hypothetical protein